MKSRLQSVAIVLVTTAMFWTGTAVPAETGGNDSLAASFAAPPQSARPRVWWHWMGGNVTREGIRRDLEWMKRVGIGGVQNFDASFQSFGPFPDTSNIIDKPIVSLSSEWRGMIRYAVRRADKLGLEFAVASSPGWSETGGPWVTPEQAMKKLVWSELEVIGGRPFKGVLPRPPETSGPFQNIPYKGVFGDGRRSAGPSPTYYRDISVIALRVPPAEQPATATVSASAPIDVAVLNDGDLAHAVALPDQADGSPAWIQFTYRKPQTIRSLTFVIEKPAGFAAVAKDAPAGWLMASDDGKRFRRIAALPSVGTEEQTLSFPPLTARYVRVTFEPRHAAYLLGGPPQAEHAPHRIAELVPRAGARINRFEDKAGFSAIPQLEHMPTPKTSSDAVIKSTDVLDLTPHMKPDGTLDWTPPPGLWVILRFGYSLTGWVNHPATSEATGLEVDKLSQSHVMAYAQAYLSQFRAALGPELMGKRGLGYMVTDSYEAGAANWTDDMIAEFTRRRGYDLQPWLPVLTGRVVKSAKDSDAFLWDFRKTLGDLIADAHYGELTKSLHAVGMGRYGESHEMGRAFVGDGMQVKKTADVPMGAMWASSAGVGEDRFFSDVDIRESASVAHLYGQNLVAAESFTAFGQSYAFSPEDLKPAADRMILDGLNRFVIHTSVHQPLGGDGPGLGLGPFGQWFTRRETWAEQAGPWISYLSRSSFLLQRGHFVADVLYFYGEDSNITALYGARLPSIPEGYAYDFVNADALVNLVSVDDDRIVSPSGASYRVLVLDPAARMTLPVLRKLNDMVRSGAIVIGAKPNGSPSLADDAAEFRRLADRLWADGSAERKVGAGKVIVTGALDKVLSKLKISPDLAFAKPQTELGFVHRKLDDGDLYFIANRKAAPASVEASFRVSGKAPELWYADSGRIEPVSYRFINGRTVVPLKLESDEAVFVVFRQPTATAERGVPEVLTRVLTVVQGPWNVAFQPNRGAPARAQFETLASWTTNTDPGVKYFSGTAIYTRTIEAETAWFRAGERLLLDLGDVKNIAAVTVNGKPIGEVWKAPFQVDVTEALKEGQNIIEIAVTNLWPNRLIGDKQPGPSGTYASAAFDPFTEQSPLLASGLLGPVSLLSLDDALR